jgi:nucleotide-binding universal stress UspA family protein
MRASGPLPPAPFSRVLCAVDGSRHAAEAVKQAATLCGSDGQLTLLAVTDVRGFGIHRTATLGPAQAEAALADAVRAAQQLGVDARATLSRGVEPQTAILTKTNEHDLLVLGAHGHYRGSGYLLGSTAVMSLHSSPIPVLVARPDHDFPRHLLLATDGSAAMASTVDLTAALARRHDARVSIVHVDHGSRVIRHELAQEAVAILAATGTEPVIEQPYGHAPIRVAAAARDLGASLVITGSRMLSGWHVVTSVSERIAAAAPCSVLVMRQARG